MTEYIPHQIEYVLQIVSEEFPEAHVKAFLIGGLAVNQYGYARNTLDVDFMLKESDQAVIHPIMVAHGYINRRVMDNVVFYHHEKGGFRADFLSVDARTHELLSRRAKRVKAYGFELWMPHIEDLIAMKIFALSSGKAKRIGKDLPDIAHLCLIHDLDLEGVIKPLCEKYHALHVYNDIVELMEAIRHGT